MYVELNGRFKSFIGCKDLKSQFLALPFKKVLILEQFLHTNESFFYVLQFLLL